MLFKETTLSQTQDSEAWCLRVMPWIESVSRTGTHVT